MPRLQLLVYQQPGQVEIYLKIKRPNGESETQIAVIDTGAQISLLPDSLLEIIEYRPTTRGYFEIQQAGLADHVFKAMEADITVYLEDIAGNRSETFVITAWFAPTSTALIGFGGILERAVFHVDMPQLSGYLEL